MQSMGIWSLNHDITISLGLGHTPVILKSTPDLHRCRLVFILAGALFYGTVMF
jgi:hypothetical protein